MTTTSRAAKASSTDRNAVVQQRSHRQRSITRTVVLAAVAGLIGFGLGWWVFGNSDSTSGSREMPFVVERWRNAWVEQDAGSLADLYADDGVFRGILAVGFEGRDQIRANIDQYWVDMQIIEMEPDYVYSDGSGAVVVWNVVTSDDDRVRETSQAVTDFEWDWDDPNLLRSTSMNW